MGGTPFLLFVAQRVGGLVVIGFLAVTLAGPAFMLAGALAMFAFVGLLLWLPIRVFLLGQPIHWDKARDVRGMMAARCAGILPDPGAIVERTRQVGRLLASIAREASCGAVVGAMLGWLRGTQGHFEGPHPIPTGLLLGACVGMFVALRYRSRERTVLQ